MENKSCLQGNRDFKATKIDFKALKMILTSLSDSILSVGNQPVKDLTTDNAAQTVSQVGKDDLSKSGADVTKDIELLPDGLERTNLDDKNTTHQPVSPSTALNVTENVQPIPSTASENAQSLSSSCLFGGNGKTQEIRLSNASDGPTFVPTYTEDDTPVQPQSVQQSDIQNQPGEQPVSFGNFTSYEDMHGNDIAESLPSVVKQQHYTAGAINQVNVEDRQMTIQSDETGRDRNLPGAGEQVTGANGQQSTNGTTHQGGATAGGIDVPISNAGMCFIYMLDRHNRQFCRKFYSGEIENAENIRKTYEPRHDKTN